MNLRIATFGLLALLSGPVLAGQISGIIQDGSGPLRGALVSIDCSGQVATDATDDNGRYNIYQAATGPCTLDVYGASARVFSSRQPTRHNFVLTRATLTEQ